MSGLGTKKSGSKRTFGAINAHKRGGTPQEFAVILATEAVRLKLNPKIGYPELVAQALGTIDAEGGFDGSMWGGDGTHIGPFAMEPSYGSEAQRLNKVSASRIALEHWKSDGETWVPGWWKWEEGETEGNGGQRAGKYKAIALSAVGTVASGSKIKGATEQELSGIPGIEQGEEVANAVFGGIESAEDFLVSLAETLLDFRKLGQLAVEAFAWFIRLIAKAIWDYVIAPLLHWTERATVWYSENFFGTGTEQGSGFGNELRAKGGIITIAFWAIGYGVLWTDGSSLTPQGSSSSMVGQAVKGVEGKIARRKLIKPSKVKQETPDKPTPKPSTIQIERAQTFSVGRKRPVSVTSAGSSVDLTGRNDNASSQRRAGTPEPSPVARPQRPEQKIHLPVGVTPPQKNPVKATAKLTPKSGGTGVGPRGNSGSGTKVTPSSSGKKRG